MVKIQDVAKEAGVSVSTVSRVLNNSFTVTEEKRKKVLEAVEKVGYQAIRTRTSKTDKSKCIMVITSICIQELFDSIRNTAHDLGYSVLFNYIGEEKNDYENSMELLRTDRGINGIIIINNVFEPGQFHSVLGRYPVVQVGQSMPMSPSYTVNIDDIQAGYDVAQYLLQKGYKSFGFVPFKSANYALSYSNHRYLGFLQALQEQGIEFNNDYFIPSDYSVEGGREAAWTFAAMKKRPEVVCCVSDTLAAGCINGFKEKGMSVPEDIAVTGFDNSIEITEICTPSITTVDLPKEELGVEAVLMMEQILQFNLTKGRKLLIPHSVIPRDSA